MFSRLVMLTFAWLLSPAAMAQIGPVDRGTIADLRGATSVFVDTAISPELRDVIVAGLRRELPQLTIVEEADAATLVVTFSTSIGPEGEAPVPISNDRSSVANRTNPDSLRPPPQSRYDVRPPPLTDREVITSPDNSRNALDEVAPNVPHPRAYRYAVGSVLKPSGTDRFIEPFSFTRRIGSHADGAARDFVRKFAKAYRKANTPAS